MFSFVVDVEQLVAHAGEYDAADIGGAKRRIEQVGILAQAQTQHGLGPRGSRQCEHHGETYQ